MSDNGAVATRHGIDAAVLTGLQPLRFAERGGRFTPLGDTGLVRFGGILADEPDAKLRGHRWVRIVREMVASSPVIKGALFAIEMLIRRAEWAMEPAADGGTEAQETADFVESCRFDMRASWADTLAQILSFLPYGYSLHEIVYKRRLGVEGTPGSAADDGLIGWDEWSPRAQDTVTRWVFDERGHVTAFEQQAPSVPGIVVIPLSRCLHFRAGGYRGSPEGESVLRAAYGDWDAIRKLQIIEAIGIERDLAGLPTAWIPANYLSATATAQQQQTLSAVRQIVTGVRNNDQAGIVMPLEYDDKGNKLFDFQLLSAGGERQFDVGATITRRATQMTMALAADFIMLGHEGQGSYALSQDKTQLFTTAISAWLDVIAETIGDQAIGPLLRVNGMDARLTPSLRPGPLDEADLAATGAYLRELMPLIDVLNTEDRINLVSHLFNIGDWPEVTTTAEELERQAEDAKAEALAIAQGQQEQEGATGPNGPTGPTGVTA